MPPRDPSDPATLPTLIIPPRRQGSGRGWRSPRGPPCSALVRWHVWHERTYSTTSTSWLTHKARRRTSDPVLARPKCPRERAVMPVAEHLCAQAAASGDPQRPLRGGRGGRNAPETSRPLVCVCGVGYGGAGPRRWTSLPRAAAPPRRIGPKTGSMASSVRTSARGRGRWTGPALCTLGPSPSPPPERC